MRQLPTSYQAMARLLGALEALEHNCRWVAEKYPDVYQLDSIRHYLQSIDTLEAAGRFSDCVTEKRKTAITLHPSGKNRDLTDLLESPNTHPPAATQPPEGTEGQGAAR